MKSTSILKQHKLFVALCLLVFCAGLAQAQDTAGPAVGDTLDLRSFQTRTGVTLFDAMKQHSLAMLILVDPNCSTCTSVQESLRRLRDDIGKTQMAYYIVMIPDASDPQKYFSYADSLKLNLESFVQNSTDPKAGSLAAMPTPAHFLITNEGLVIQKWSGIPQNTSTP